VLALPATREREKNLGLHDQWYKNAILYCLDVETFADSNGDGIGDFRGLTSRLDYLAGLGVSCLWLMPFYPSPGRDDGYDVSDYAAVDPRLGTMADFVDFIVEARERGMHVVVDLVPNHTSIEHPWFQAARNDPDSKYHDYYVWREDDPGDTSDQVIFPGEQEGIWTYEEKVKKWYLHHFYKEQPDLNFANPAVREEFRKIVGLWLQLGIDGFRVDAAPFLINLTGVDTVSGMDMAHQYLEELREYVTVRKGNAILLGEVDEGLSTIADYFGGGNQLQALFNFPLNRFVFLGLAQASADPIKYGMDQLPTIPGTGQWVNFLRHHDELNLSRMTSDQREEVFAAFGPDPDMQVFDRGLRRRLAPMLEGDQKRLHMAYTLLFSLPGAPMLFYGEEIGMGEQPDLESRMAVRAPMQWTSGQNGGFSTAKAKDVVRPPLEEDPYGYSSVNVKDQRADPDSLLNWMATLIRVRKESAAIGTGEWSALDLESDPVLGLRHDDNNVSVITLVNLSDEEQSFELELTAEEVEASTDLFEDELYPEFDGANPTLSLNPYGYRWIRVGGVY
jgi:maltose alpha-D-glucosyltransferase / alpha-amylase